MAIAILVLGVLWAIVRIWSAQSEARRRAAHEERMARLLAERDAGPSSLSAVVQDATGAETAATAAPREIVRIRCRSCRALNDEGATTCAACGAEL